MNLFLDVENMELELELDLSATFLLVKFCWESGWNGDVYQAASRVSV